ncbi:beta-phosphoglucomutase [Streptococcus moroccensis]|uniref:Beta-phosphoglucomutase n=1 Tax=Streptococcus moroccensis TaxID=1451356 RepID=A0ABT9YV62_9STRE|nr:beta-phosphoglucomutase [Streptococcus moroccensis]MDQ0223218.1 beta-phosphoglucomutase [Streptococcus moroccensis]
MFKGALFDLDGVIADTAVFHFAAWRNLVKKYFDADLPDELEEKTKGVSREDSLRVILDHLHISVPSEEFSRLAQEKNEAYIEALDVLTPDYILPGIADFIQTLQEKGIKLALASASKNGPIILEKLGLADAFDAIADPAKVAAGKPAPDIFKAAAQGLGLAPEECIGVEDAVAGVTAINASGAYSVAVGGEELDHAKLRFESTADLDFDKITEAFNS